MHSVDADTIGTIDRYRAAYDEADDAGEEQPESYERAAARLLYEFARLGHVAWAVLHPLRPLSAEVLIEAGQDGAEELHELLPELERFGQAILTQGDPSRLGELTGLGERVQQERALFEAATRDVANNDATTNARHFGWVFENYLLMLDTAKRATILAEFEARIGSG